ncbi:MAG: hypothetical protein Q9163_000195 [Psora crenata]
MRPKQLQRKPRPAADYGNYGSRGRRTGIELKDSGIRDANGIEPIPSFSSPQKGTPRSNDVAHDETAYTVTYTADETMEIDQTTAPEPTDVMRGVKNAATRLGIPRSVSPRKNLMYGSPRRSVGRSAGPMSSPSMNVNNATPSHAPVNRQLDFSADKPHMDTSPSKEKQSRRRNGAKKGPFDLSMSDDEDQQSVNGHNRPNDDDPPEIDDEVVYQNTMQSFEGDTTGGQIQGEDETAETVVLARPKRKRGRRTSKAPSASLVESQISQPAPTAPRRGRPPKKSKVHQDADAVQAPSSTIKEGETRMEAPMERDPDAQPEGTRGNGKPTSRAISVVPRSGAYTVARNETPATDGGAFTTRSGRTSIKPLASWRGEKAIFGPRPSRDILPGIQEVVRTDEVMPPPRKRVGGFRPAKRRPRSQQVLEEIEEEEEEVEPWEAETGILHAMVMQWNPNIGRYDEENIEQKEIAFAARAIDMRDIQDATFKFAKTLTLPFFGSGMVHLPPGGEKRVKNSRKMQMVFFVYYGRVTVNVGTPTTTFSIGKGGQWQVPRGNFYSIINESEKRPARLFFAQGCQWSGETEESATAPE